MPNDNPKCSGAEHTPGPWVSRLGMDGRRVVEFCEGYVISIGSGFMDIDIKEIDANAELIASAPAMKEEFIKMTQLYLDVSRQRDALLEACNKMADGMELIFGEGDFLVSDRIKKFRQAIADCEKGEPDETT